MSCLRHPRLRTLASPCLFSIFAGWILLAGPRVLAGQVPASAGSQMADQAYRELALHNYPTAIDNFKKALAEDPSNSRWRKDLGYTYSSAGLPQEAEREFRAIYRDHPDELAVALELGYLSQQMHEDDAAERYFSEAAGSADEKISKPAQEALINLRASHLQMRKQRAYDLLVNHRRAEAIKLFEQIHEADPSDGATTLQLGYAYEAAGDTTKARQMFRAARSNSNPDVAAQAAAALTEANRRSAWWFTSFYAAPFYQSRFSNEINVFNAKVGMLPHGYLQPYLGVRFSRDTRSRTKTLPEIYSDNSAVFSMGIQSPIPGHVASLYAEAGSAVSLLSTPTRGRAVPDYRAGMDLFRQWGSTMAQAQQSNPSGFSFTGNAYSDISFYSRYDNNIIGDVQLRHGVNLPTGRVLPMQILAAVNVVKDSNRDFYNNIVEAGPALRVAPFRHVTGIQFEAQYVHGFYTFHDAANPFGPRYHDFRLSLIWGGTFMGRGR